MDISLAPKLLAAAVVGGTVSTSLPRSPAPLTDTVMLRLEWVQNSGKISSESLTIRAQVNEPTIIRQGRRTVEVTPTTSGKETYNVQLKITDGSLDTPESIDTGVRVPNGETVSVVGTVLKEAKSTKERMLFLTATPYEH